MCGISGIIAKHKSLSVKDKVFAMNRAIKHRGPDGEGFSFFDREQMLAAFSDETPEVNKTSNRFLFNPATAYSHTAQTARFAFGHRRLSIIDLSESGHQPMCDTSARYWITYNGEIYNYKELKKELIAKGHAFVTQSDTEVIIEAYKEWGVNCLERFNGMWAFALYDQVQNYIFCARDRVGVKPFYYINNTEVFAFASEYKAFIKAGLVAFEVNEEQQFDFLINAEIERGEQSLFKHIHELKPAHYGIYKLSSNEWRVNRYYTLPAETDRHTNEKELIEKIEQLLLNSVRLRLRSDVEIGSCLSGGIDSSVIAGMINRLQPGTELKLFTAVFPGEKFDESNYAKMASDFAKGQWQTVSPTATEFFRDIKELNYYQDLPVWGTSTYSQHRVMQLASEHHIKVVLDGQGADELFAGYAHHYLALWRESSLPKKFVQIKDAQQTISNPYRLYLKQAIKDLFGLSTNYSSYFTNDTKTAFGSKHEPFASNLNKQLAADYHGRLKSFLKCEDRCGMAFGIESRVPFADDVALVDLLFKTEGKYKIQKGISKYLLREASKAYLPSAIYNRKDKIGFETPVSSWIASEKDRVLAALEQLSFVNLERLKNNYHETIHQHPQLLLRLYSLAMWKQVFSAL